MYRVRTQTQRSPAANPKTIARRIVPPRDFRARGKLRLVVIEQDRCLLCEGTIDRFDRHSFHASGRCCACEAT